MFLFILITFHSILGDFLSFWTNPEIQDGGLRWLPFGNDYTIITLWRHSLMMQMSKETFSDYLPSNSHFHSFYILRVMFIEDKKNPV